MSEETPETNPDRRTDSASQNQSGPQGGAYPARDADNGEEQRNRLGYMATEPTEEEIEEGSQGNQGNQEPKSENKA